MLGMQLPPPASGPALPPPGDDDGKSSSAGSREFMLKDGFGFETRRRTDQAKKEDSDVDEQGRRKSQI
jgi:hypothetical protein